MSPQENTNSVHRWQEGSQSSQPLHPHVQTQRQGSTERCFAVVWQGQPCQNSSYQIWLSKECSAQGTRVGSGGKGEVGQCSAPCRAPDLPANQEPQQCQQRGFFSISLQNITASDGWANLSVYLPWRYAAKSLIFGEITSSSVGRKLLKSRAFLEIENCCKGPLETTSKFVVLIKTSYTGRWKNLLDLPGFETTSSTREHRTTLYVYLCIFMTSLLISQQTVQRSLLFLMLHLFSPQS